MTLHNRKYLKENRKQSRNSLTPAEAELWNHIKDSQLQGRKFRRQHSIGNFIVDFYCPAEKLVIELDGQIHFSLAADEADYRRDEALQKLGIRVLRFENKYIFQNLDAVLDEIVDNFRKS